MALTYMLQLMDKFALAYATLLGIIADTVSGRTRILVDDSLTLTTRTLLAANTLGLLRYFTLAILSGPPQHPI